jgi:hypothetical protein
MKEPVIPLGAIVYVIFIWTIVYERITPAQLGLWYLISLGFLIAQGFPSTVSMNFAYVWGWIVILFVVFLFSYAMMGIFARYAVAEGFQAILRL